MPISPTSKWYNQFLTPQTVVYLFGGVIALVIFWIKTQESWVKVKELEKAIELKANAETVKDLDEKVTRQYSVQREQNLKEEKTIEEALDWQHYWEGYWKGMQEKK